jgi:hypothetical protein
MQFMDKFLNKRGKSKPNKQALQPSRKELRKQAKKAKKEMQS